MLPVVRAARREAALAHDLLPLVVHQEAKEQPRALRHIRRREDRARLRPAHVRVIEELHGDACRERVRRRERDHV